MFEIGHSLREARVRQGARLSAGRARDEDPREVHPRARGGRVRSAARRARTSRASCGRTRSSSASTGSSTSTSTTRGTSSRASTTCRNAGRACIRTAVLERKVVRPRARRDRGDHGARDRRVEVRRRRRAEYDTAHGCSASVRLATGLRYRGASGRARTSRSGAARLPAQSSSRARCGPASSEFLIGKRFWLSVRKPAGVRFLFKGKPVPLKPHHDLHVVEDFRRLRAGRAR